MADWQDFSLLGSFEQQAADIERLIAVLASGNAPEQGRSADADVGFDSRGSRVFPVPSYEYLQSLVLQFESNFSLSRNYPADSTSRADSRHILSTGIVAADHVKAFAPGISAQLFEPSRGAAIGFRRVSRGMFFARSKHDTLVPVDAIALAGGGLNRAKNIPALFSLKLIELRQRHMRWELPFLRGILADNSLARVRLDWLRRWSSTRPRIVCCADLFWLTPTSSQQHFLRPSLSSAFPLDALFPMYKLFLPADREGPDIRILPVASFPLQSISFTAHITRQSSPIFIARPRDDAVTVSDLQSLISAHTSLQDSSSVCLFWPPGSSVFRSSIWHFLFTTSEPGAPSAPSRDRAVAVSSLWAAARELDFGSTPVCLSSVTSATRGAQCLCTARETLPLPFLFPLLALREASFGALAKWEETLCRVGTLIQHDDTSSSVQQNGRRVAQALQSAVHCASAALIGRAAFSMPDSSRASCFDALADLSTAFIPQSPMNGEVPYPFPGNAEYLCRPNQAATAATVKTDPHTQWWKVIRDSVSGESAWAASQAAYSCVQSALEIGPIICSSGDDSGREGREEICSCRVHFENLGKRCASRIRRYLIRACKGGANQGGLCGAVGAILITAAVPIIRGSAPMRRLMRLAHAELIDMHDACEAAASGAAECLASAPLASMALRASLCTVMCALWSCTLDELRRIWDADAFAMGDSFRVVPWVDGTPEGHHQPCALQQVDQGASPLEQQFQLLALSWRRMADITARIPAITSPPGARVRVTEERSDAPSSVPTASGIEEESSTVWAESEESEWLDAVSDDEEHCTSPAIPFHLPDPVSSTAPRLFASGGRVLWGPILSIAAVSTSRSSEGLGVHYSFTVPIHALRIAVQPLIEPAQLSAVPPATSSQQTAEQRRQMRHYSAGLHTIRVAEAARRRRVDASTTDNALASHPPLPVLRADMRVFRHCNPACHLADFLSWYYEPVQAATTHGTIHDSLILPEAFAFTSLSASARADSAVATLSLTMNEHQYTDDFAAESHEHPVVQHSSALATIESHWRQLPCFSLWRELWQSTDRSFADPLHLCEAWNPGVSGDTALSFLEHGIPAAALFVCLFESCLHLALAQQQGATAVVCDPGKDTCCADHHATDATPADETGIAAFEYLARACGSITERAAAWSGQLQDPLSLLSDATDHLGPKCIHLSRSAASPDSVRAVAEAAVAALTRFNDAASTALTTVLPIVAAMSDVQTVVYRFAAARELLESAGPAPPVCCPHRVLAEAWSAACPSHTESAAGCEGETLPPRSPDFSAGCERLSWASGPELLPWNPGWQCRLPLRRPSLDAAGQCSFMPASSPATVVAAREFVVCSPVPFVSLAPGDALTGPATHGRPHVQPEREVARIPLCYRSIDTLGPFLEDDAAGAARPGAASSFSAQAGGEFAIPAPYIPPAVSESCIAPARRSRISEALDAARAGRGYLPSFPLPPATSLPHSRFPWFSGEPCTAADDVLCDDAYVALGVPSANDTSGSLALSQQEVWCVPLPPAPRAVVLTACCISEATTSVAVAPSGEDAAPPRHSAAAAESFSARRAPPSRYPPHECTRLRLRPPELGGACAASLWPRVLRRQLRPDLPNVGGDDDAGHQTVLPPPLVRAWRFTSNDCADQTAPPATDEPLHSMAFVASCAGSVVLGQSLSNY